MGQENFDAECLVKGGSSIGVLAGPKEDAGRPVIDRSIAIDYYKAAQGERKMRSLFIASVMGLMLLSTGCASHAAKHGDSYSVATGEKALATARSMIGRPYQFRGETPEGFDCSGLVRYSYLAAGKNLPHGTGPLRKVSRPVGIRDLQKGDLLFFDQSGKKYSHVGIYAGDTRFIHAPSSGKKVRMDSLEDEYWKNHLLEGRRP
jgi:hypothetical protein